MDDTLITLGGAVKALGQGKFEAPLITFGSEVKADLTGDFFTADCDFWTAFPAKVPLIYGHGLDATMKSKRLGDGYATLEVKDAGVFMTGQLNLADEYESAIYDMVKRGKIGTSSGSANHLVEREVVGKAHRITSWPIVEASLTPTPAEPENYGKVVALKSYHVDLSVQDMLEISVKAVTPSQTLSDELDAALAAVETVTNRAKSANDLRIKSGRVLSATTRAKLQTMHAALNDLLASTEPAPAADAVDAPSTDSASQLATALSAYMDTEFLLSGLIS